VEKWISRTREHGGRRSRRRGVKGYMEGNQNGTGGGNVGSFNFRQKLCSVRAPKFAIDVRGRNSRSLGSVDPSENLLVPVPVVRDDIGSSFQHLVYLFHVVVDEPIIRYRGLATECWWLC
jgi:hypothetical protein